jgi:hypothetical protein
MTICASRITDGTSRDDDHYIVTELHARARAAREQATSAFSPAPAIATREAIKASTAYHKKWSGTPVHPV